MKNKFRYLFCFAAVLSIITLTNIAETNGSTEESNLIPKNVERILQLIGKSINTRNFKILTDVVSKNNRIYWGVCYVDGDLISEFSSFSKFDSMLLKASKGAQITIDQTPVWLDDLKSWIIKTQGWSGEEPFLEFILKTENNRIVISGICTSAKPDPNAPLPKPAQLPRPGPRVFKNVNAFHARIGEIVRLGAFDALRTYAVRQSLNFSTCNGKEAKEVSVNTIIDFLMENNTKKGEIKFFNLRSSLETEDWAGTYPYISFRFAEVGATWEWAGISYCKSRPEEHARKGKIYYERY